MTAATSRSIPPQSVLGFTHTALSKLKGSRELLLQYVQHKTSEIDSIQKQNEISFEKQQQEIRLKLTELKRIQRQRGCNRNDANADDGTEVEGIQQQQEALREKQHDVERELANFHLENKNVSKMLLGECHYLQYQSISF
jgi:hypothetical protein